MTTIRPKLLSVYSSRFDFNQEQPPGGNDFCEWLEIELTGEEGFRQYAGDVFGVFVCSPGGLTKSVAQKPHIWGHRYLFVSSWSAEDVEKSIQQLCDACEAPEWSVVVARLSRYLWVDTVDQNPDSSEQRS
jgi:hypothetical protein